MKAFYKIAALVLGVGLLFTACKEKEEEFMINSDLYTRFFSNNGFQKVHNWEGVELIKRTTTTDITTNDVISFDEIITPLGNKWLSFSDFENPYPVHHNIHISTSQTEEATWRPINNDRIIITSDKLLKPYETVDYYIDIETTVEGPAKLYYYPPTPQNDSILIGDYMWNHDDLKMIYENEEVVGNHIIHTYREYNFSRVVPQSDTRFDESMGPFVTGEYKIY